jgi:Cu/Ag efflux pump CusA
MFRWIIGSSLKLRFLVLAGAAVLLAFGIQQMRRMPLDVFPEFASLGTKPSPRILRNAP